MAILQSVLQKFSRKPPMTELAEPARRLAKKIEHYAPLFALQEKRQLIEVTSERTGETYQSMILAIDLNKQTLELDELFPQPASHIYRPGDIFTIKHHHQGQILTVSTPLESILVSLNSPVYCLRLPEEVSYQHRRKHPRISLSRQQPLSVRLQSPWRTPWYATANNISTGGMRLVVGGNVVDQLARDVVLPECEFKFHDNFQIRCQATVKAFRFMRRPYRRTEISIEFKDLGPQQSFQLHQLITALQAPAKAA